MKSETMDKLAEGVLSARDTGRIFRQVVEKMGEGCIIVDASGTILFANPAMERLTGRKTEALLNTHCTEIFPERARDRIIEVQEEHRNLGHSATFSFEILLEKPDRSTAQALLNGTTIVDGDGKLDSCFVLITDIKDQAEKLRRLKELDVIKNDFISMVSHELNTPIAAAAGALSILSDEVPGALNRDQRKYIDIADRNVQRLSRLTADLLSITRIESRGLAIDPLPLDLRIPVMAACQSLYVMVGDRGLDLRFPGAESEPVMAHADSERIQQVVVNLVRNAARFAVALIEVRLTSHGDFCRIIVEDDGPGLYPEDIPLLFEKFYRGRDAKRAGGGSGLGLAIVKGIVDAHGGLVMAENRRSREEWEAKTGLPGARIVVTLPSMGKNTA